jgi:hypothetical protein
LEAIELLSSGGPPIGAAALRLHDRRHHRLATQPIQPQGSFGSDVATSMALVTLPAQTASLGSTLTNFTNVPLSPALNLFDSSLGTLVSVTVGQSANIQSLITSQNLSTTSATVITASLTGSYQIDGLNQPIVQPPQTISSQPTPAGTFGSGSDTITFPPLQLNGSSSTTFTDAASLAFFTASPGRTTITPTMTATASGSASAPNGNLSTTTQTSASASMLTVSFTYMPSTPTPTPTPCPTPGTIGRIGVHHQRTLLILPFNGTVNPTLAGTASDYTVITRTGKKIPIISANYNPATNSVTLRPAHRLNVHLHFRLSVVLPCPPGMATSTVIIPFGGRRSLIGFHDHRGQFVPVHDGRIVRFSHGSRNDHRADPIKRTPALRDRPFFFQRIARMPDAGRVPVRVRAEAHKSNFLQKSS